jgi:hypothetical protein
MLESDFRKMSPATSPGGNAQPFFLNGSDDRPLDIRTVAVAIIVRTTFRVAERDASAPLGLHEIAVLRRYYEHRGGGTIRPEPGFPPGLSRFVELTHDKLKQEQANLARFIIPRIGSAPINCFAELFGSQPQEQLTRLHKVMKEQLEAWNALAANARKRLDSQIREQGKDLTGVDPRVIESMTFDLITERELEEIINLADPSREGLGEIELQEVLRPAPAGSITAALDGIEKVVTSAEGLKTQKVVTSAEGLKTQAAAGESFSDKVLDRLTDAGIPLKQADAVVSLLEIEPDPAKLSDDQIVKALGGKANLAAVKAAFKGA